MAKKSKSSKKSSAAKKKPVAFEDTVAGIAATAARSLLAFGDGNCRWFVHHVLAAANAKSFYEYNPSGSSSVFAAWGEEASAPQPGYIVVFKDVVWTTTKGLIITDHKFTKHIAIVLAVRSQSIYIAQQGVPGPDASPSYIEVPLNALQKNGVVKYFRPVPMQSGKTTSSPTAASQAAVK